MAQRKAFLLRIDPEVLERLQHWADDELRSLNGQIEFLLRRSLADARRVKRSSARNARPDDGDGNGEDSGHKTV